MKKPRVFRPYIISWYRGMDGKWNKGSRKSFTTIEQAQDFLNRWEPVPGWKLELTRSKEFGDFETRRG